MNIVVLNGSPHLSGATNDMVSAFIRGAEENDHEVTCFNVAHMKINGCMGCMYCKGEGKGKCVQKDDMQKIYPVIQEADMIVFASPIYYFTMTAQLQAALHRTFAIGTPRKAKKTALILSSGSDGVYESTITQYKSFTSYWKIKDAGIFTAHGDENKSEKKRKELYLFAKSL